MGEERMNHPAPLKMGLAGMQKQKKRRGKCWKTWKRRRIRILLRKRGQPPLLPRSWVEEETALMTRRMKKWLPREGQSQEAGQEINLRGGATGPVREGQSRIDPKREGLEEERGQRKEIQEERGQRKEIQGGKGQMSEAHAEGKN